MIVVHLAPKPTRGEYEEHVRVVIHEPKERSKLDMSIINPNSEIYHRVPEGVTIADWLRANYVFKRQDPTPYYNLTQEEMVSCPGGVLSLSIQASLTTPRIITHSLGSYTFENGEVHDVYGFFGENVDAKFFNVSRNETVCYHLSTAKRLVEVGFLNHLHEHLTAKGFNTQYTPPES